jgi:CHAD domain-containing protein
VTTAGRDRRGGRGGDRRGGPAAIAEQLPDHPVQSRPPGMSLDLDQPAAVAVAQALQAGVAVLRFHEAGTRAGDVEAVHQFRVGLRRLRALVELTADVIHGSRIRYYRAALRLAGQRAGAVRDCDAIAELLRDQSKALDPAIARAVVPVYQALADRRVEAMREMEAFLDSVAYARLIERLANVLTRKLPADTTIAELLPAMLPPIVRDVRRSRAGLTPSSTARAFHRLRIRIKRMRYALEMTGQPPGKRGSKALKRLRRMQEHLGQMQDLAGGADWLRHFTERPGVPAESLVAVGALLQLMNHGRQELAASALHRWRKLDLGEIISSTQIEIAETARTSPDGHDQRRNIG